MDPSFTDASKKRNLGQGTFRREKTSKGIIPEALDRTSPLKRKVKVEFPNSYWIDHKVQPDILLQGGYLG